MRMTSPLRVFSAAKSSTSMSSLPSDANDTVRERLTVRPRGDLERAHSPVGAFVQIENNRSRDTRDIRKGS